MTSFSWSNLEAVWLARFSYLININADGKAPDPALAESVGFITFLQGFFETGHLIQYPDFLVNNVALMVGEALLSESSERTQVLEETGFPLIRYPLEYWLVDRGHSADVTFKLYSKFVRRNVLLLKMDKFSFDFSHAVSYAIASPQNYTRKSASTYVGDLVKFAFQSGDEETEFVEIKRRLRAGLTDCLHQVCNSLTDTQPQCHGDGCGSKLNKGSIDRDIKMRFCQLICDTSADCPEWFSCASGGDVFTSVLELCCQSADGEQEDGGGLYSSLAHLVAAQLVSGSVVPEAQQAKHYKLLVKLMKSLCQHGSSVTMTEVMRMACTILLGSGEAEATDRGLMVELSLLPLFLLVGAVPNLVQHFCPEAITITRATLDNSSMFRPLPMMKEAVENLYSVLDKRILHGHQNTALLNYLSFQVTAPPHSVEKPLLSGKQLRDEQVVKFAEYSFHHLQNLNTQNENLIENLVPVVEKFMRHSRLSHMQIHVAVQCYRNLVTARSCKDVEVLHSVLQTLQLKMVDLHPNIQEVAVKAMGDLLLIDGLDVTSREMLKCLKALWQCVDYKAEGVAVQVLEFVRGAITAGKLDDFRPAMAATNVDIIRKAENFLMSSSWDNIKPVAFKLLSELCPSETVFRYARASLQQHVVQLRVAVFEYVQMLFESNLSVKQSSIGQSVKGVTDLLSLGWGDVLLDKANSVETCNFRQISATMESLFAFMQRKDVCEHVETLVSELMRDETEGTLKTTGLEVFDQLCEKLMLVYGHVHKRHNTNSINGDKFGDSGNKFVTGTGSRNESNADSSKDEDETPAKKCKYGISGNNSDSPGKVLQKFFDSVLNDKETAANIAVQSCHEYVSTADTDTLDSTKELPPLVLSNEPNPSRKIIEQFLSPGNGNESEEVYGLVIWLVCKEILERIQPASLSSEAQRSTDEYERNCSMLLHDFHQLLNKSFQNMKEDLQGELVSLLLTKFSDIVAQNQGAKSQDKEVWYLNSLISLLQHVNTVLTDVDKFSKFVFNHRKSLMLPPSQIQVENSPFVLEAFLDRLNALRCRDVRHILAREMYPSEEGLSLLLNMFSQDHEDTQTFLCESEKSVKGKSTSADYSNSQGSFQSSLDRIRSILNQICPYITQSNLSILNDISAKSLQYLCSIMNEQFEPRTIQDAVRELSTSSNRKSFTPILQCIEMLCRKAILGVLDGDLARRSASEAEVFTLFSQLQSWYLSESEFDSDDDNDPTALDCV